MAKGGGFLTLTEPWPGMLRTIYGDDARYQETYWSRFPGRYFAGDGAKVDEDGYWWILGRVDDVLNVAGHRIGTMEVESALVDHPAVAEAAVVGKAHDLKGQAIAAFVTLKEGHSATAELRDDLREHVAQKIGAIARPDDILFSADLPKTRSGKIMRRLLRDIAEGRALGDTTTLADPSVVARLKEMYEDRSRGAVSGEQRGMRGSGAGTSIPAVTAGEQLGESSSASDLDLRSQLHHPIRRQPEERGRRAGVPGHEEKSRRRQYDIGRGSPGEALRLLGPRRRDQRLAAEVERASGSGTRGPVRPGDVAVSPIRVSSAGTSGRLHEAVARHHPPEPLPQLAASPAAPPPAPCGTSSVTMDSRITRSCSTLLCLR